MHHSLSHFIGNLINFLTGPKLLLKILRNDNFTVALVHLISILNDLFHHNNWWKKY